MGVLHDFCVGYPYAVMLMAGGLMGFIIRGSTISLVMGLVTGALMFLCAHLSLRAYRNGGYAKLATAVGAVDSAVVSFVMAKRYPPMRVTTHPALAPGVLFVAVRCVPLLLLSPCKEEGE